MTIWLTSDTHFGHAGIIGMAGRQYASTVDHDEDLVARWNAVVRPRDTVWHVGDFALSDPENARRVFERLHGRKLLVRGNHDGRFVLALGWQEVHDLASQRVDGVRLILCHYPMLEWRGSAHNRGGQVVSVMCHGHVHGTPANSRLPHQDAARVDVGVDMHSMAPVAAEALVAGVTHSRSDAVLTVHRKQS